MRDLFLKLFKFGIVGASGVVVDFGITWILKEQLRLNKYVANTTGFVCAVLNNYFLNRIWTFESHDPSVATQFSKFALAALIGLAINNGIIYWLTERYKVKFYMAKLIATGIVTIWNFWANYTFTFHG